jgi:hypothetical protein
MADLKTYIPTLTVIIKGLCRFILVHQKKLTKVINDTITDDAQRIILIDFLAAADAACNILQQWWP